MPSEENLGAQARPIHSSGDFPLFCDLSRLDLADQFADFPISKPIDSTVQADWIWLDGIRIFQIADSSEKLAQRRQRIQTSLQKIYLQYLHNTVEEKDSRPQVEVRNSNQLPVIYINNQYLMTITQADSQWHEFSPEAWAEQLRLILTQRLQELRGQRQPNYLIEQAKQLAFLGLAGMLCSSFILFWRRRIHQQPVKLLAFETDAWVKRLSRQQQTRLQGVKLMLLQLWQAIFWSAAAIFSLSRFPQTRPLAIYLISLFRIPLVIALAILASYLSIRLSHLIIDRFSLAVLTNPLLLNNSNTGRTKQRISTLTRVIKGVLLGIILFIATLISLLVLGVNIGPILAGAGILGVALSLASQGLIKDAINGSLILIEDQYGVGDVVEIDEWIGLVETLNLRMTQLRNAEGKLITIPNSEVRVVANLSSHWSRVDLNIPIPYDADLPTMMSLIQVTANTMMEDAEWRELILEVPELLGVDDFSERGLVLKLWIKTQPLRQWDVAREYRRRLKLAMDTIDIVLPVPQRSLRFR